LTTLLISAGTAFSASSPLHYTLCWDNQYAHTGATKENMYLYALMTHPGQKYRSKRDLKRKLEKGKGNSYKPEILSSQSKYCLQMPQEYLYEFFCEGTSIENYIKYYLRHWDIIKNDYKAVADFSNQNAVLSEGFLREIKPKLLEYFDVKIVMVFRDPIRRLWSVCNKVAQTSRKSIPLGKTFYTQCESDDTPYTLFRKWVSGELEPNAMYSNIYSKYKNVWGEENVHMVVMEEFWSGKTQPLSDFLDFPIDTVHENVYWPDKGSKAPHYEHLKDQWISNTHDLDLETWKFARENIDWVYKDFERTFGYIPDEWGKWYET
tara:strand:+ start:28 stop:987 length:960 start_codon:yes stop_codon:yes gene_type:complete